jgi:8-oxo-dGTP diphosphatase
MAARRVLRVAELIPAELSVVRAALEQLPSTVSVALAELPSGTLVTLEMHPRWWDRRPRGIVVRRLRSHIDEVLAHAGRIEIVAAAIIRNGRVLAAQRDHPAELAGGWEFPGGKVERGESAHAAISRECREELGIDIVVGERLATQTLDTGAHLILFEAAVSDRSPDPVAHEHRQLRWLSKSELTDLDWLVTNKPFVLNVIDRL